MSPAAIIKIQDLDVRFADVAAVAGASFSLSTGSTMGLVGESGSGKTTLARAMVGLSPIFAGHVRVVDRDLATMPIAERRRWLPLQVQMVFQDPGASLSPRLKLGRLLAEPLRIHGLIEHKARIGELLSALGLPNSILDKFPHQVSGGQARRIAIARALVLRPRFLIADEPTAGLDVSVQGDFLNLMIELQKTLGLGTLFVSHNLNVVARMTDRLAVMYLGKVVEDGDTRQIFSKPAHPYTAALLSATPEIDPARRQTRTILRGEMPSPSRPPAGCRFHTRCPLAQARCGVDEPALRTNVAGRRFACHFPLV